MIKAVFLDMDDTLIVNHVLYEKAAALLYGYLRHFGVSLEEAHKARNEIDRENYKTFGYSRKRYPQTFEDVLKHFVPDADDEMVAIVRDFAETVFTTVAKEKPGIAEAIDLLSSNYKVYIVTQGDNSVQTERLKHLSFRSKLSGEYVVDRKDKEAFTAIVKELGLAPDEVIMMGDSLKSDIVSSIAAGLSAVWVESENWSIEAVSDLPKERMYKFSSVLEAAQHIVTYGTAAPQVTTAKRNSPPTFKK